MNLCNVGFVIAMSVLASGCAVGNQYDYRMANLPMSVKGQAKVGVSVAESRPYVLSGNKSGNFVGLQRGGFGNPFDVSTQSGRALVEDMNESLSKSLAARGFSVVSLDATITGMQSVTRAAEKNGLLRVVVLDVKEWKSDAMMQLTMHHDLVLGVYDAKGNRLAEARSARTGQIGSASFQNANAAAARGEFERVVGGLFEDAAVKEALQAVQ